MRFIRDLLSTVTSPVFSEVVIILQAGVVDDLNIHTLFPAVQYMSEARPFRLVFWLEKLRRDGEYDMERLKEMISVEAAEGGLGDRKSVV